MGVIASQITSRTIIYSTVYSGADKKSSKRCVTGLCAGNSLVTGEFPAQMTSNAENVSFLWRHYGAVLRRYGKSLAAFQGSGTKGLMQYYRK